MSHHHDCEREHDFSLVLSGVADLSNEAEDALFEAGCDDSTQSLQYGAVFVEFSRRAPSLKDAILSAIQQVRSAGIGADVLWVDECNLVTFAEIGRRTKRSRQTIHNYMTGQRGPGGFPPPVCSITDGAALWSWCQVSFWLHQNGMIRPEELEDAEVVAAINNLLELQRQRRVSPKLTDELINSVGGV